MKILQIISSLDPKKGGPIENVKQLSSVLEEYGHQVEIVTLDEPSAFWAKEIQIKTYFLGPSQFSYRYCPKLTEWIKNNIEKYDAVIVRGLWEFHGFATWKLLKNKNIPYFVFPHGMLDPWFRRNYPLKHLKKMIYWKLVESKILKDAKAVLFTSEKERFLARQSFRPYECKEEVICYGTMIPPQDKENKIKLFLKQYPQLQNKVIILFVGRIHSKKGCDLLIKAFAKISQKEKRAYLIMAGPDQVGWTIRLRRLSKKLGIYDKIIFTGMLSGDLKWGAFYASDVFVLPSHQENFGIVIAEALGCGCPVLITNKINIWKTIEKNGAGFVAGDTQEGVQMLLDNWTKLDDQEKQQMRKNAKRCFEDNFEIHKTAQDLISILKKYGVGEKDERRH